MILQCGASKGIYWNHFKSPRVASSLSLMEKEMMWMVQGEGYDIEKGTRETIFSDLPGNTHTQIFMENSFSKSLHLLLKFQ